jgi:phage shock protein C
VTITRSTKEEDVNSHRKPFSVNKADGKVLGVCAGIADHFGLDVSLVRVGMALAVLMTFPMMLVVYFIMGMVASETERRGRRTAPTPPRRMDAPTAEATRQRMRDIDARMQAIETHVTSTNNALAREIDELR